MSFSLQRLLWLLGCLGSSRLCCQSTVCKNLQLRLQINKTTCKIFQDKNMNSGGLGWKLIQVRKSRILNPGRNSDGDNFQRKWGFCCMRAKLVFPPSPMAPADLALNDEAGRCSVQHSQRNLYCTSPPSFPAYHRTSVQNECHFANVNQHMLIEKVWKLVDQDMTQESGRFHSTPLWHVLS